MIRIYGSEKCPDCVACKENFDHYGVEYEFLEVLASLKNLKEFLIYRDREAVFDRLKAIHDIGLPACIDEDGTVFTDWEKYLRDRGMTPSTDAGAVCDLTNRKGC